MWRTGNIGGYECNTQTHRCIHTYIYIYKYMYICIHLLTYTCTMFPYVTLMMYNWYDTHYTLKYRPMWNIIMCLLQLNQAY